MLVLAAALAVLTASCGPGSSGGASGGHGAGGHAEVPVSLLPSKPSKPMTVQQLATGLGCRPELGGQYADYRLGWCNIKGKRLVLTDFDTTQAQRSYLTYSKDYGGTYLVGDKWCVTGNSLAEISPLQDKFGGKIEQGEQHGVPPPSSVKPEG